MRKFLLTGLALAFVSCVFQAKAQQVVATSGGYYEGANLSMSWTVGEPVIETFTNGTVTLTQGFQQPYNFYLRQILNIPMGWSGISSYLDPLNKSVDGIFSPVQNDLIIMASMNGLYYPAQSINTIGNWDYNTGYQLKAENDFDLTITGLKIQNPEVELSAGWNLVPVLSSCDVEVENLFAGFTSLQIVKEVAGTNLYWPAYNINTLGNLSPGKAYFLATEDVGTLTFPQCTKTSPAVRQNSKSVNITPWNELHQTAASHTIAFPKEAILNSGIVPGDVIGAFTPEGICAGRLGITNQNNSFAITAFANDEVIVDKDGFESGEPLQFKIYRPSTGQEFEIEVNFDPALPDLGYFTSHGLSAVQSLKLQTLGFNESPDFAFEVYPNPSHGIFNLSLNQSPQNLKIQISDIRGSLIKEIEPGAQLGGSVFQIDLSGNPKGVYFLKMYDDGFVGMKKVVID